MIRSPISSISRASSSEWDGRGHGAVEALVALDAAAAGLDVGLHEGQGVVDAGEVVVGAPGGRERGDLGLQRVAGLDDLGQPVGVGADRLDDAGRRPVARGDDGAVAVAYRDHADHLERDQRLAERGAADAEPCASSRSGGSRSPAWRPLSPIHDEICSATCS